MRRLPGSTECTRAPQTLPALRGKKSPLVKYITLVLLSPTPWGIVWHRMKKQHGAFGVRVAEAETVAKRYILPRYVVEAIEEIAPPYGSKGRTVQVGAELLSRIQYHPIPLNESLKRKVPNAEERIGMTYKLMPRTIEIINKYSEIYETRAAVFEAIITLLSRKFIA